MAVIGKTTVLQMLFLQSFPSGSKRLKSTQYLKKKNLLLSWPWSCTTGVSRGASRENALICVWIRAAQCCSTGAQLLSKTHPWLVEAKGVPMVLQVLLLPGLLELLPQPPYPVMVTGGELPAATERKKSERGWGTRANSQKSSCVEVKLELAGFYWSVFTS